MRQNSRCVLAAKDMEHPVSPWICNGELSEPAHVPAWSQNILVGFTLALLSKRPKSRYPDSLKQARLQECSARLQECSCKEVSNHVHYLKL